MPITNGQLRFGYDGDRGVGRRLIDEVLAGTKTATCMPLLEYPAPVLEETRASVGRLVDLVDASGQVWSQLRIVDVYETVGSDLDPRMLSGEGYGDDAQAFLVEHLAGASPQLVLSDPAVVSSGPFARLPLRLAAVVFLHDASGMSVDEIAEVLGQPVRVVRAELRRGRVQLADPHDGEMSCREARPVLVHGPGDANFGSAQGHAATCEACTAVQARLDRAAQGSSVADYTSLVEENEISRLTGREAILSTVFVVTEFVRA